jgi:hypothetical protein
MSKFIIKRHLPKASPGGEDGIPADDKEEHDESGHARVDDPVLPPARMLKVAFSAKTSSNGEESSNRSARDSILSRLFDPDRKQKPALWTVRYSRKILLFPWELAHTPLKIFLFGISTSNSLRQDHILPRECYVGGKPDI